MKLKRWPEALTDLEASLASDPNSVQTHQDLAEVYKALGSSELSLRHRDRAAVLEQTPIQNQATQGTANAGPDHPNQDLQLSSQAK